MDQDTRLIHISETGRRVIDLMKIDLQQASQLIQALSREEQISLVSHQAIRDPKSAQDLLFLVDDGEGREILEGVGDRPLFRIMKSQSSTHIGVLNLVKPERLQSVLDLDQELFSAKGITDPQTAYHWLVSFLEEEDEIFTEVLKNIDLKVVASAFQDKIIRPTAAEPDEAEDQNGQAFAADFLVKLDRGELKPDDLQVADEETLDVLTRIHVIDAEYFGELVSVMIREEDLKTRAAEEALDRIHEQIGDMTEVTEEAESMFVPLEE
jgi:hypothetical protein